MKILLLTDIPPCKEYTGGMVIESLVKLIPKSKISICAVVNKDLDPTISDEMNAIQTFLLQKPREKSYRIFQNSFLNTLSAYLFECFQALRVHCVLMPKIIKFANNQEVDTLWVLLEGQTMVRLAKNLSKRLSLPLYTQVHDPFELWLRSNKIDKFTSRRLLKMFDKVILKSKACATASWAMSEKYTKTYGVKNFPVIASLPVELTEQSAETIHERDDFIISIAGQIYALEEWYLFLSALNAVNWKIEKRNIKIRVLSAQFQICSMKPAHIEYFGWQSQEDTISILSDSDLLYLPYWFSDEFDLEARYCFPSKLVSYFASGRPVLCHAPAHSSPAQYIAKHESGYVCDSNDPNAIIEKLRSIILDRKVYAKTTKNGTDCFMRDFTREKMKESFFKFLEYCPTESEEKPSY